MKINIQNKYTNFLPALQRKFENPRGGGGGDRLSFRSTRTNVFAQSENSRGQGDFTDPDLLN